MLVVARRDGEREQQDGHRPNAGKPAIPQAEPLIEGLSGNVLMGDAAYDSDALRSAIGPERRISRLPNNPHRQSNILSTKLCLPSDHVIACRRCCTAW